MSKAVAIKQIENAVQAAQPESAGITAMVERIMMDPSVPIDRVNQAFDFYQKVQADTARKAFDEAMAQAKAKIPPIVKSRKVEYGEDKKKTSYSHEDLAGIATVVDPILSEYGLSYRFRTTSNLNEPVRVTCVVAHRLGHFEENTLMAGADNSGSKNSIQAIGSTITYLQRYTLKAALGLAASHDDDGKTSGAGADEFTPVSDAQSEELRSLIQSTGTDVNKFLEVARAESISDVLAKDFDRLKAMLVKKKGRQQ